MTDELESIDLSVMMMAFHNGRQKAQRKVERLMRELWEAKKEMHAAGEKALLRTLGLQVGDVILVVSHQKICGKRRFNAEIAGVDEDSTCLILRLENKDGSFSKKTATLYGTYKFALVRRGGDQG